MSGEEKISKEEYTALMEKFTKVEELLIAVPNAEALEKFSSEFKTVSKGITSLEETVEKAASIDSKEVGELIAKAVEEATGSLVKEIEVLKETPLFKGTQEGVLKTEKPEKIDVMDGIFKSAYPELREE